MKAKGSSLKKSASKTDMDEKTARKYMRLQKLPSEMKQPHDWRTRMDPFEPVWDAIKKFLEQDPRLKAQTAFAYLQRENPGQFSDGQLRTLQRRFKIWRAIEGPSKEICFEQVYEAGDLCESDFTHMDSLGVTINAQLFKHLVYHFVLAYSNWECITLCNSECFEALSEGLQNAFHGLGGVPKRHRTDRLSAAINNMNNLEEFTKAYQSLLSHYHVQGFKIQTGQPHENGDVEQSQYRFKDFVDQDLILRGSRDFRSIEEYRNYLQKLVEYRNQGRQQRFIEEQKALRPLPSRRLDAVKRYDPRVTKFGTIRVQGRTYSIDSRLKKEKVQVWVYANHLDVWFGQRKIDMLPRLRGEEKSKIQYRHIIDSLVRKPGAFENYRYREQMYPTHRFRIAYDILKEQGPKGTREYLKILQLAAMENETAVDTALSTLLNEGKPPFFDEIFKLVRSGMNPSPDSNLAKVASVDLTIYDSLLQSKEGLV